MASETDGYLNKQGLSTMRMKDLHREGMETDIHMRLSAEGRSVRSTTSAVTGTIVWSIVLANLTRTRTSALHTPQ